MRLPKNKARGKEKHRQPSILAFVLVLTFKIETSALLSTAVFKSGQNFCEVRKRDFWRKPSWQRAGKGNSSPKERRDEGCCHLQLLSSLLPDGWGKE